MTSEISKQRPTTICVFCGSSPGTSPAYLEAARSLAKAFHEHGVHLVYGGGTVGLMGEVAKTLAALSGPKAVHGVIPRALVKYEQAGRPTGGETPTMGPSIATASKETLANTTSGSSVIAPDAQKFGMTTIVSSMHERKHLMTKLVLDGGPGSGFIALPGGYGTLEELAEVTTWNQLGIHGAGVVMYDVDGFWQPLVQWISDATKAGFIGEKNKAIVKCANDAEGCLRELREYQVSTARFDLDWTEK